MNTYLSDKLKVISFISMVLVVFLHAYNLVVRLKTGPVVLDRGYNFFIQEFISQGMGRIAVPLFFTISGYLFFLGAKGNLAGFGDKIRKRFKTLFIPFLFWSLWSLLLCYLFQLLPPPRIFFANQLVRDYTTTKLLSTIFIHPIAYQLWFLRDLMIMVLLSPLIFWVVQRLKFLPLFLLMLSWFYNANLLLIANEALFFFAFGASLALHQTDILLKQVGSRITLFASVSWVGLIVAKMSLVYFNHPQNTVVFILVHKLGILFGMLALWGIYDQVLQYKKEGLLKLAAYSFFIYAFHEPFIIILKPALFTLLGKGALNSLLVYIFAPLISILLGIFVAAQLKRTYPSFYGWITGGR